MVIHGAVVAAVQSQPAPAVTAAWPVPPLDVEACDVGAIEYVHPPPALPAAPWVMVTVCPATLRVPVRGEAAGLAAAEYVTGPLPVPEAPVVIEIQSAPGTELHAQP